MKEYEISGESACATGPYGLRWPFRDAAAASPSTTFTLAPTKEGFAVHFEAILDHPAFFRKRPPKGRVFEDDCLELFVRPRFSCGNPEPAPFYYGWEINAGGILLDYRAGIGEAGRRVIGSGTGASVADGSGAVPGVEPVHGILHDDILGTLISFDYDWKSKALVKNQLDEAAGIWRLDLEVPWSDFGLDGAPHGETWHFTVNRIDAGTAAGTAARAVGGKQELACLHEGITEPRFHQPDLFPALHIR